MYTESITELVVYEHKHCELQKFAYIVLVIKHRSTRPRQKVQYGINECTSPSLSLVLTVFFTYGNT